MFNNSIDYYVFRQSSNKDVILGQDGWLFYQGGENPLSQSLGQRQYSQEELQIITDNLVNTERILANQGIEFVLFIAPNKESIYMDKVPGYYERVSNYTCVDQLVDYVKANTDIRVVYPKEQILKARKEYDNLDLYYKVDTHWNSAGAYIGAVNLAKELGLKMPSLGEVSLEPIPTDMHDLKNMLNVNIKSDDDFQINGIGINVTECIKRDLATEFIYHTEEADKRKLFVMRDSYSDALAPLLATQFEDSIFVHYDDFSQKKIFNYGADVFVHELVERRADTLLDFRVSCFKVSVGNDDGENKNISVSRAIKKADYSHVSISVKNRSTGEETAYQTLEPFRNFKLQVPADEEGEITIRIFEDKKGKNLLEERVIPY